MYLYSFDNNKIIFDKSLNLWDFFTKTIVNKNLPYKEYIVTFSTEMNINKICWELYNNYNYIEELLVFNDIIDSYSIKIGDIIKYLPDPSSYNQLYKEDITKNDQALKELLDSNNKKSSSGNLTPTIKPDNLQQIEIDYNTNQIKIINKYQ